jgi:hypothetical protein
MAAQTTAVGDKVQIKAGHSHTGHRGEIEGVNGGLCRVRLDDGTLVRIPEAGLRNFSSAARQAWNAMPDRRVGRPKGSKTCDRVSVTLRLDRSLWSRYLILEQKGQLKDRTSLFNEFLKQIVDRHLKVKHA